MRRPDTSRKAKRDEVKERKKQEKQEKKEELKMLKKYKLKEIQEKLEQLKSITGNASLPFQVLRQPSLKWKTSFNCYFICRMMIFKVISIQNSMTRKWARFLIKITTTSTTKIKSQNFHTIQRSMTVSIKVDEWDSARYSQLFYSFLLS